MKNKQIKDYIYLGLTAVAVIAVCILFWNCIRYWSVLARGIHWILGILAPITYGAVLAYLTSPVYNRVTAFTERSLQKAVKEKKHRVGISKAAATVCCLLFVAAVVLGLVRLLIPQLVESLLSIRDSLPIYIQNLYAWVQNLLADNPEIEMFILRNLQNTVSALESWAARTFSNIDMNRLAEILTGVSSSVMGIVTFFKNWFIGMIVMVYLLNIKDVLMAQGKKMIYGVFRLKTANKVVEELRFVHQVFGGFIIGKLVDSLIIGILCFIAVSLMKMPFPMLLSVIVGVTNVIPFFGPFIGGIPTAFLVLLVSPVKSLYYMIWIILLQQFDGNILGPKILGNSTGLSSFWVLFSILLFGGMFGFIGMIIAVPLWAVIYDLLARGTHYLLRKKDLPLETEEYKNLDHIDEETGKIVK